MAQPKYQKGQLLTGAEAQKFLQDNPDYGYDVVDDSGNVLQSTQGQSKSYGILDDIGAAILSPVADISTGTAEQLRQKYQTDTGHIKEGDEYQPQFMSKDEWDQYVQNPLGKNLQNVAGMATFFIPAGKGITGLMKAGAIAGGLSGFSQSDLREGDVLSDIAKGTLIGGGTGLALGVAGKGLEKLTNKLSGGADDAAKLASQYDDIINAPDLGAGANSAKPFNNAFNKLSSTLDNLDDPLQRQQLQQFVDRIAPAAQGGLEDAADVIAAAKSIYGVTPSITDDVAKVAEQATRGVEQAGEKGSTKLGDKLRQAANEREQVALNKAVGTRASNAGAGMRGADLERAAIDAAKDPDVWSKGVIKSAQDLDELGGNILSKYGDEVSRVSQQLTDDGALIALDDITGPLKQQLAQETNERLRTPIQNVLDEISQEFSGRTSISPSELYRAKQGWGKIANFLDDTGKSVRSVYGDAYHAANDALEATFDAASMPGFRDLNRKVEAGLKMQKWAEQAGTKARPGMTVTDMLQDAMGMGGLAGAGTGFAVGGPVGAAAGYGISKFSQSAAGERLVGKVFNKAADVVDFLGGKSSIPLPKNLNIDTTRLNNAISALSNNETVQKAAQIASKVVNSPITQRLGPVAAVGASMQAGEPVSPDTAAEGIIQDQQMMVEQAIQNGQDPQIAMANAYAATAPSDNTIYTAEVLASDPDMLSRALSDPVSASIVFQMAGYDAKESAQMLQLMGLTPSDDESSKEAKDKAKMNNAVAEMERLYGVGTDQTLSLGDVTVGIQGLLGRGGREIAKVTDQNFNNRLTAYNQMAAMAAGLINQARGAGTLNEGEFQTMMKNIPNEYSSEQQARDWFKNVKLVLGSSGGSSSTDYDALDQEMLAML